MKPQLMHITSYTASDFWCGLESPHRTILGWVFVKCFNLSKPSIMVIIFWDFAMSDQMFLSPKVKRSVIISNKLLVYTSCSTIFRRTKLGNIRKISKLNRIIAYQNEIFYNTGEKILENRNWAIPVVSLFHMKIRVCLKYFLSRFYPWLLL